MKILSFATAFMMLLVFSCQESGYENDALPYSFNKSVGKKINSDVGLRWIQNNIDAGQAPKHDETFGVSQTAMNKMLDQDGIIGITFYYGLDDDEKLHVVMTGINQERKSIWSGMIFDTNTGKEINYEVAERWIDNFKHANQDAVIRHSYGVDMFAEIRRYSAFEIMLGLDDKGKRALLLLAQNPNATDTRPVMWDNALPCPPYCP